MLPLTTPNAAVPGTLTQRIDTNPDFPTVQYRRDCGTEDFVQVFTTVSLDLDDRLRQLALPDFSAEPERWRLYGFAPGEVLTETEFFVEEDSPERFSVTDTLDGVPTDDANVFSYQWIFTSPAPSISTGAWVATRFEPEPNLVVEVFVVSGFIDIRPRNAEFRGSPLVFGEDLLAEIQNPLFADRFACVAETWQSLEPIIAEYERMGNS